MTPMTREELLLGYRVFHERWHELPSSIDLVDDAEFLALPEEVKMAVAYDYNFGQGQYRGESFRAHYNLMYANLQLQIENGGVIEP